MKIRFLDFAIFKNTISFETISRMQKIGFLSYFLSRKRIVLPFLPPGIFRFERTVQSLRFSSGCKVHLFHLNDFPHSFPQIFPISRFRINKSTNIIIICHRIIVPD